MEATISGMVTRIHKGKRPRRLFITEWFEHFDVNDEKVANRLVPPVARETVFRWRKEQHRLNPEKLAQLADALGIEPEQFWRAPSATSLDAMVKDAPAEVQSMAADIVRRMVGKGS